MAEAVLKGKKPEANNTKDYDNGVKVVPSMLLESVIVYKANYQKALIDSGYYHRSAQLGDDRHHPARCAASPRPSPA